MTISNRLKDDFPNGRVTFVVPSGKYTVTNARIESSTPGDDGRHVVLVARVDIPANGQVQVTIKPAK